MEIALTNLRNGGPLIRVLEGGFMEADVGNANKNPNAEALRSLRWLRLNFSICGGCSTFWLDGNWLSHIFVTGDH
jgi:hypothetical protein